MNSPKEEPLHKLRPMDSVMARWPTTKEMNLIRAGLHQLRFTAHEASVKGGWYHDPETGEPVDRNIPEMLALIHSEISEMLEAWRKDLMDDKLPHRPGMEVEAADVLLRLGDLAGALDLDIAGALVEKLEFNRHREDHKPENRAKPGGKKC